MSDLSAKFSTLEGQLSDAADEAHTQRATAQLTLEDIQTALSSIDSDILELRSALLSALASNGSCVPCTATTLLPPAISPTSNPIDEDKCKRSQAFIHAVSEILHTIGAISDNPLFWSPATVLSAISEVVTTLVSGGTVPVPSFTEASSIVGSILAYFASNVTRGDVIGDVFDGVSGGLTNLLYSSNSPGDAQSAYNTYIGSQGLDADEQTLIEVVGFTALYNYFFDPDSTPDLSAYDGSACAFPSGLCFTFTSVLYHEVTSGSPGHAINQAFGPFTPASSVTSSSGVVNFDQPVFYGQDGTGWTWEILAGNAQLQYRAGGISDTGFFTFSGVTGVDGTPHLFPSPSGTWAIVAPSDYTVRICKA